MNQIPPSSPIPVTVVTGFLGSGKTTFLNHLLTKNHGKKLAVVLNEIGDINLDAELIVESLDEDLKVMNNGCVCCTVRGDLSKIALQLLERGVKMDALVIETTGMADPSPVAQTFFMDESLADRFALDAVITVVDSLNLQKNLKELDETQLQIGFADVILLNKIDLVNQADQDSIVNQIREINSLARIIPTTHSNAPMEEVFGIQAFDLGARTSKDPDLLVSYHKHRHDDAIQSIYIEEKRPLDLEKLNKFFSLVLQELGEQILRFKGVAYPFGETQRIVFQGVHMNMASHFDSPFDPQNPPPSKMVFIGRHLPADVLQEGLSMCVQD
jgi:G3E family GTPase